jgi:hypothetical protein
MKKLPILPLLCLNLSSKKPSHTAYSCIHSFQDCIALSKEFRELPMRAGSLRVRSDFGNIYLGKTRTLRDSLWWWSQSFTLGIIDGLKAQTFTWLLQ